LRTLPDGVILPNLAVRRNEPCRPAKQTLPSGETNLAGRGLQPRPKPLLAGIDGTLRTGLSCRTLPDGVCNPVRNLCWRGLTEHCGRGYPAEPCRPAKRTLPSGETLQWWVPLRCTHPTSRAFYFGKSRAFYFGKTLKVNQQSTEA